MCSGAKFNSLPARFVGPVPTGLCGRQLNVNHKVPRWGVVSYTKKTIVALPW